MKKHIISKISCLFLVLMTIHSCGKEDGNDTISTEKTVSVSVNITGVKDQETSASKAKISSKTQSIPLGESFLLTGTISQNNAPSTKSGTETALSDGVTYRVIVYKNSVSTANWVASKQFSVGNTSGNLFTLSTGGNYVFVCYSFNNTDNLPFDGSTGTTLTGVSGNVDLLYKQISMTIADGTSSSTNVLNIVFAHEFSRIKVVFNSQIGNITALSGLTFSPNYPSVNLDVSSAGLTYNGSSAAKSFNIPAISGTTSVDTGYSLFCLPSSTGTLSIGSLTVNGTTKSNLSLNYAIAPGSSYTITLTITGLTTYGLIWAPGNLTYNSSTGIYSFATADSYGDYWFYNYLKPKIIGSDYTYQSPTTANNGGPGDPCSKVLPENTWRLPTTSELNAVISATSASASTGYTPLRYPASHYDSGNSGTNPGMFLGTQTDPGSSRSNYLFFPFGGGYYNSNTITSGSGLYLVSGGTSYFQIGSDVWTTQLLSSTQENAFSIRCVRSTN